MTLCREVGGDDEFQMETEFGVGFGMKVEVEKSFPTSTSEHRILSGHLHRASDPTRPPTSFFN